MVEFAPNQKAPPEKKKADSRHATIQQGGVSVVAFLLLDIYAYSYR